MITYNTSSVDVLKGHYYIKYFMAMKYGFFFMLSVHFKY